MIEIDVRASIDAPAEVVYELLDDSSSWPTWTPIESAEILTMPGFDGSGEVRAFRTGRVKVTEEIVERIPNRRLVYILLGGLAVRQYRAEIDLTPHGDTTDIRWHTTFRPHIPGTGWVYNRALTKATEEFVAGLASAASRERGPSPA